ASKAARRFASARSSWRRARASSSRAPWGSGRSFSGEVPVSPSFASNAAISSARPAPNLPCVRSPISAQRRRAPSWRCGPRAPSSARRATVSHASRKSLRPCASSRTLNPGSIPTAAACRRRIWPQSEWMVPICARPRSRRTRRQSGSRSASTSTRERMRPFSSAAAFSVNVTAHSLAGGSGSEPPSSSRHSSTRRCVFPVPAPAWITALPRARERSGTGYLPAVLGGVGGQRDQPAKRLQLAIIAAQRPHREPPRAHLLDAVLDRAGERKRVEVDPVLAQGLRPPGVLERKIDGVDAGGGLVLPQHRGVERELELRREERLRLQPRAERVDAARLVVDDEQRAVGQEIDPVHDAAHVYVREAEGGPGVRILESEPALELDGPRLPPGLDHRDEALEQLGALEVPQRTVADVLFGGERFHLRRSDLAQQGDLLRQAAQRQSLLVPHAAEEALQAAVQQRASLARAELGVVEIVHFDAQQSLSQRPERAGGVVLELMRGERTVRAESKDGKRALQGGPGELAGKPPRGD